MLAWEVVKIFLLLGGLLVTLVLIGRWWGANDAALSTIRQANERIEGKVAVLIERDHDQDVRLRVLELHEAKPR